MQRLLTQDHLSKGRVKFNPMSANSVFLTSTGTAVFKVVYNHSSHLQEKNYVTNVTKITPRQSSMNAF